MGRVSGPARVMLAAAAAGASALLGAIAGFLWRRPSPDAGTASAPGVSQAEREAVRAARGAQALLGERTAERDAAVTARQELESRVALLEERLHRTEAELESARRFVAEHTAVANENLRLRGAVDALTAAIAASRREERSRTETLEAEIASLHLELLGLESQVKEMADERDRAVDEVGLLQAALAEARRSGGEDRERRLRSELAQVRRSLEIERQRNLRLGRRRQVEGLR